MILGGGEKEKKEKEKAGNFVKSDFYLQLPIGHCGKQFISTAVLYSHDHCSSVCLFHLFFPTCFMSNVWACQIEKR